MKKKRHIYINAPITLGFIGICLLALLLNTLTAGESNQLLFMAYRSSLFSPLTYCRFITHVFGHVDWSHFFGNAMYLLLLGPNLEEKYQSKKIIFIIFLTALCSAIINTLLFPNVAICGASGIVFAFILLGSFTNTKEDGIPVTLLLVALFFLGQQIYEGILSQDSISQLSHIVGGLIGATCGFIWNRKR